MAEYVKYCPLCGAENPRQGAFCRSCLDGDLSSVPAELKHVTVLKLPPQPPPDEEAAPEPDTREIAVIAACLLEVVEDPRLSFRVQDSQTVGRSDRADVALKGVPKADWISGVHARLFRREDQWYVQHLGQTNFIKVDGEQFKGREEVPVYDGSILVLSLTAFRIKMG